MAGLAVIAFSIPSLLWKGNFDLKKKGLVCLGASGYTCCSLIDSIIQALNGGIGWKTTW